MPHFKAPHLIDFGAIGDPEEGYISVAAMGTQISFEVRRAFWTYETPANVVRGRHAHHHSEMVLIAVSGTIRVTTETTDNETGEFILDTPARGLYIPPMCWRTMTYAGSAVQLVFASTEYSADDYIRSYDEFRGRSDR
jgi:mannose-6-phosphate isomerase-like protein (cupin superfamily)